MQAAVKKSGFKEWMRKNGTGYAFLLPFLILFAVFVIVPVAVAMYYSLTNYNMIQPARFVGMSNYSQLILDDDVFLISLKNTMVFAVITGPIGDKPFRILADRFQITRYYGAGLSAKEALDLMNRGRLPLITDPDDGTGRIRDPGGHAHRHGG